MAGKKTQYKIKIIKDENSKPVVITGAVGGVHPSGDAVVVHFYHDYPTIPESMDHEVLEGGVVNLKNFKEKKGSSITRVIETTSVIPTKIARTIGKWLIEQADATDLHQNRLSEINSNLEEKSS